MLRRCRLVITFLPRPAQRAARYNVYQQAESESRKPPTIVYRGVPYRTVHICRPGQLAPETPLNRQKTLPVAYDHDRLKRQPRQFHRSRITGAQIWRAERILKERKRERERDTDGYNSYEGIKVITIQSHNHSHKPSAQIPLKPLASWQRRNKNKTYRIILFRLLLGFPAVEGLLAESGSIGIGNDTSVASGGSTCAAGASTSVCTSLGQSGASPSLWAPGGGGALGILLGLGCRVAVAVAELGVGGPDVNADNTRDSDIIDTAAGFGDWACA